VHPRRPNVARNRHIIDIGSTLPYVKRMSGPNSRVRGGCGRCAATRIKPDARPSTRNDETRLPPPIRATRAVTNERNPDPRRTLVITSKASRGYRTDQPRPAVRRSPSPTTALRRIANQSHSIPTRALWLSRMEREAERLAIFGIHIAVQSLFRIIPSTISRCSTVISLAG